MSSITALAPLFTLFSILATYSACGSGEGIVGKVSYYCALQLMHIIEIFGVFTGMGSYGGSQRINKMLLQKVSQLFDPSYEERPQLYTNTLYTPRLTNSLSYLYFIILEFSKVFVNDIYLLLGLN